MVALAVLLVLAGPVQAQTTAYASREQALASLPGQIQGLSMVGGNLYVHSSGVQLEALWQKSDIIGFMVDTTFVRYEDDMNYVVRHPLSGDLYFTRLDRHGRSCLYVVESDSRRPKAKRVKMDDIAVEHPTFSADGRTMVFSSAERRRSYGGYDLWYSRLKEGEWTKPVNLGNRVNSQGDDVTPTIVGEYLYFSSNGREDSKNHLSIYVTRLVADHVTGDTVGMLQIGRSRVHQLPMGINSAVSDCYDFVVDRERGCCHWVNSSSGLRTYCGELEAVTLWGHVYNNANQPLSGVKVTASHEGSPLAAAITDATGFYRLTLPTGQTYSVEYSLPSHFRHQYILSYSHPVGDIVGEVQHDVSLDALAVGRPIYYTDLFGPDAVIDLSDHGIEVLDPLVRFLGDNPTLGCDLTLSCDLTDDVEFNSLLTARRLQAVEEYLRPRLPESTHLTLHNGCNGRAGCSDATGISKLTVLLK